MTASRERLAIWGKTLLVTAGYLVSIGGVHLFVTSRWIKARWLSIAITFAVLQISFSCAILLFVYIRRRVVELQRRIGAPILPRLRECLALHSSGEDQTETLTPLMKRFPAEFETALFEFLRGLRGGDLHRLRTMAVSMGLPERWAEDYRSGSLPRRRAVVDLLACVGTPESVACLEDALKDPDESIRLNASRALLARGGEEDIEKIFRFSLFQAPIVRALVAEDLRPYLLKLAEKAVPEALRSKDNPQVLGALDMIWAWGRVIDVPEAIGFIDAEDRLIRAVAIHASRYAAPQSLRARVAAYLADPAPVVRRAAAEAAGIMGVDDAIPGLRHCLADPDERVSRAAARALAGFGAKGLRLLEDEVLTAPETVAAIALESLEKARIGRLDWES